MDGEVGEIRQIGAVGFPKRLDRQRLLKQGGKIVHLLEANTALAKPRLQVFFGALLGMKAHAIIAGVLPRTTFAFDYGEIAFGLGHPLMC